MRRRLQAVCCKMLALASLSLPLLITGCQPRVSGFSMASDYYLRDDVQYFPHGPDLKLGQQVDANQETELRQMNNSPQQGNE